MPHTSATPQVIVVVPTYNERENIGPLIEQILAYGYQVLVVDDGSPDGTGEVADAVAARFPGRVSVLHRTGSRGLGRSYVEAFKAALASKPDLVCQMDADFSHDPRYLPDLVNAAAGHDLVVGSRYVHGISVVNWPLRRLVLSTLANRYIRAISRLRIRDCTGGFRCWRADALARIPLDRIASDGYAFMVEMVFEANRRGCRITEVPIVFVERREGSSKLSGAVLLESLLMPWRLRARALFRIGVRTDAPRTAPQDRRA
ncbi:MAG TPA: polyprenol monophosphomannose synthase [Vicinamibacterales bacterium]|nr:polyprenol monophosphomannose synthase [Vicinamibacterales bacterium]